MKKTENMKKLIAVLFVAVMMFVTLAACNNSNERKAAKVESAASDVKSDVAGAADNIGEGVTAAVSAVTSQADQMIENGQISDGDGIIGNEGNDDATLSSTEPTTDAEDTTGEMSIL